jgi:hypothetical protein
MKIILSKLADAWSFSLEFIEWSDTAALGCGTRLAKNACDEQVSSAALEQTTRPRFPGRVPHVRSSVHPDFLSSSLALANFMRLSLMKAAHASVGGAPCRKSGYMGRKRRGAAPSNDSATRAKRLRRRARMVAHGVKAFEKFVFGPCTLRRTWGTRPEP